MKKWKCALFAVATVVLAGCGSHDCSSSDVHDTLLELLAGKLTGSEAMVENAFGLGPTEQSLAVFEAGTVSQIVTLEKNKSTGAFLCNGKVAVVLPDGRDLSLEMNYEVRQVVSGDAEFQVLAERSDINQFRAAVNGAVNSHLRKLAEEEQKAQRRQAFIDNPPVVLSDADAIASVLRSASPYQDYAQKQHAIVGEDYSGEGYKDYVLVYRDEWGDSYSWSYMHFWQRATEPGQTVVFDRGSDQEITREHELKNVQLQDGVLTFSDGEGWSHTVELQKGNGYSSAKL